MKSDCKNILAHLKDLLQSKLPLRQLILFGSRARGEDTAESDMDVLVVLDAPVSREYRDIALDCAWEAGFEAGIVIVPVVVFHETWAHGPQSASLLAMTIREEGIAV